MKTHTTRRSLLWGTALTVAALSLVHGTATVRADNIASSSLASAFDASGSPTVKPYFWTELAQNAQAVWVAVAISGEGLALHDSPRATVNIAGGVNAPVNRALFPRALD